MKKRALAVLVLGSLLVVAAAVALIYAPQNKAAMKVAILLAGLILTPVVVWRVGARGDQET